MEENLRFYTLISKKKGSKTISLDFSRKMLVIGNDDRSSKKNGIQIPTQSIKDIYIHKGKSLPLGVFHMGVFLVLLVGTSLSLVDVISVLALLKKWLFVILIPCSVIGLTLVISYFLIRKKSLVIDINGRDNIELIGDVAQMKKLRFDINVLEKGRLLEERKIRFEVTPVIGTSTNNEKEKIRGISGSRKSAEEGPGKDVLTCPHCGSSDLYYEAGLTTGYKYHCVDCDYIGPFVISKKLKQI